MERGRDENEAAPFSRGAENKPRRKFFRFAGKRPARPTKINL